jgi:hypothetical protein
MSCIYCARPTNECERRPCPPARQNQIYTFAIAYAKAHEDSL